MQESGSEIDLVHRVEGCYQPSQPARVRRFRAWYICSPPRMGTFQSMLPPMKSVGVVTLATLRNGETFIQAAGFPREA